MIAMSVVLGMPVILAARGFGRAENALRFLAALGSIAVGALLGWRVGSGAGLSDRVAEGPKSILSAADGPRRHEARHGSDQLL